PIERAPLARRCGLRGDDALARFDVQLAETRARVRTLADRHYLRATRHEDAVLALLVQDEIEDDLIRSVLDGIGFKDLRRAADQLRQMAREPFFLLSRSRTERALAALLPVMLELVRQTPDADQTVVNLGRIVATVGGRATFYDLLAGNAKVLRMFCDLAGWANYLVALLAEVPGLPDELVDSLNLPGKRAIALLGEARLLTRGIQDVAPPLRFFQARELCTTAIRDLEGLAPERVSRSISDTALAILNAVLERCVGERAREWGLPVEAGRQTRFAVLGLGKLGSRELSYASDMDVVFVCDPGGLCRRDGRSGEQFWTKVAQELMRGLGDGRLYDIDPRLRPWGDQGELVSTMPSLVTYWQTPKDLWERMAMLRVAPVAGEATIGAESAKLIRDTALLSPLPADAATQVRDMRRRLEESVAGRDHVKRGWGGYVDHEFIAHWLSFGVQPAELPIGASVADTLRRLGEIGRLPSEAVADLVRGLALLRGVEARMRLAAGKAISSIPTSAGERSELARRCQFASLADFDLALHDARQTGRRWFERLVV
nr:hypothetical protein [Planctomycetota bacterium]